MRHNVKHSGLRKTRSKYKYTNTNTKRGSKITGEIETNAAIFTFASLVNI